jgi:hypothetical protein
MIEIILIAGIALLIFGTYKFLKKDEKELTTEEITVPELDLPIETWSEEKVEEPVIETVPEKDPEPVKEVKAISKTKKATETKATEPKKKGRPKKSK